MKKFILLVAIAFAIDSSLFTTSVSAQWSLTGNAGTTAGTNFIGTTDAKDLVFKTNGVEKGRIKSATGFQFGTSGVNLAKFDSGGNLSFTGNAAYKVAANKYAFQYAGNPNYGLFFNAQSLIYEFRTSTAASVFSVGANTGNGIFSGNLKVGTYTFPSTDGTSGQVLKTNGAGVLSWSADNNSGGGGSQWTTNGTAVYYNTGNVGIGTSTPLTKLHIVSTTDNPMTIDGAAGMFIGLYEGGSYRGYLGSYSGSATDVDFGTGGGNSTGKLNFTIQAIPKMTIDATGNIGIGTTTPAFTLDVTGTARVTSTLKVGAYTLPATDGTNGQVLKTNGSGALTWSADNSGTGISQWTTNGTSIYYNSGSVGIGTTSPVARLHVTLANATIPTAEFVNTAMGPNISWINFGSTGDWYIRSSSNSGKVILQDQSTNSPVCIGSTQNANGYKLSVDGKIICEEVKVQNSTAWPDYVFTSSYKLPDLLSVEKQIQTDGHLSGVPSADEVCDNGISLGEMQATLLQKIEELTLYMIDQQKQINQLKSENEELKTSLLK